LTVNSKIIKKDRRKIRFAKEDKMATGNKMSVINLANWAKVDVDEIRER